MPNFSYAVLTGHLTRDPKQIDAGQSTATKFSLAVNDPFHKDDPASFFDCAVWGKRGDVIMQFVKKGDALQVGGRIKIRKYEKKDGSEGTSVDVNVADFTLLGGKDSGQSRASSNDSPSTDIPF